MHSFKASLAKGKSGEALLQSLWPELVPTDGRSGDFMLGDSKVEVKSDSYNMDKTPNFFIERYSNNTKKSDGSVWQALKHECMIFVYFYPKNNTAFVFYDIVQLMNTLDSIIPDLEPIFIRNPGYYTVGYKVPRELLKDLYEVREFK